MPWEPLYSVPVIFRIFTKSVAAFDMPSESIDGMDPEDVHEGIERAVKHIRAGKGPYYLEIKTYRYKGHSVSDPAKYRTKDELNHYKSLDPIDRIHDHIINDKIATPEEIQTIKDQVKQEVKECIDFAEASDYPDPSAIYEDNYVQKDYPFLE